MQSDGLFYLDGVCSTKIVQTLNFSIKVIRERGHQHGQLHVYERSRGGKRKGVGGKKEGGWVRERKEGGRERFLDQHK